MKNHELDKNRKISTPNNWRRTWVFSKEIPLEDDIFTGDKMYKSGKCIKEIWENIWEILKNNCRKEKVYLFYWKFILFIYLLKELCKADLIENKIKL